MIKYITKFTHFPSFPKTLKYLLRNAFEGPFVFISRKF